MMNERTLKILELARRARMIVADVKETNETDSTGNKQTPINPAIETEVNVVLRNSIDFDSDDCIKDPDFEISEENSSGYIVNDVFTEEEKDIEKNKKNSVSDHSKLNKYSRKNAFKYRNLGNEYINRKGKQVSSRRFRALSSSCRKNCRSKISTNMQKKIFKSYWALGTYRQRILYVASLMDITETKTACKIKHAINSRERKYHVQYNIQYEANKIETCKACFKKCLDETDSFLKSVLKKKIDHPKSEITDFRGRASGSNRFDNNVIETVKEHIKSFPAYESHYSRRDTTYKYLHASLTLSQMYKLYCEKNSVNICVGLTKYSEIFKTMKIKFKKPKVDTCKTCDTIQAKIEMSKTDNNRTQLINLQNELKYHHNKATLAYDSKKSDKLLAINSSITKVYAFDLQQCLPTPYLRTGSVFYKRQLWTYNLTVHDLEKGIPYCYMWHEGISARGGNQIASCLFKHICNVNNDPEIKNLIFYSDSCAGQNKNSFVSIMFIMALQSSGYLELIDHKFLEPGHTHMECDIDHATIERKKKRTDAKIYHPHDWYNFVRSVGTKKSFNVIEMTRSCFYNFSVYMKEKFLWRNRNTSGNSFKWKDVRWLRFQKSYLGKIFYKNSLDKEEPFKVLNISKRGVNQLEIQDIPQIKEEAKISAKKKKDLEYLMQFIDPSFHEFYKSLKTGDLADTHPDLVDDSEEE